MSCLSRYVMQVIKIIAQTQNSFNKKYLSLSYYDNVLFVMAFIRHYNINISLKMGFKKLYSLAPVVVISDAREQELQSRIPCLITRIAIIKIKSENRSNYFRKE